MSRLAARADMLPNHDELTQVLKQVQKENNGGFGFHMWAAVVDRDGVVKVVAFSGETRCQQWPGSRVIAAQKANTANAFSLPKFALSTANLYYATQPKGSLYGLQHSNPVNVQAAYGGVSESYGTKADYMVGTKIGGVNVFGGGLPLYAKCGSLLGAIGVSGDSSCADHNIAWKIRHALELDYVPAGVGYFDNIVNDFTSIMDTDIKDLGKCNGTAYSKSGWGHPVTSPEAADIAREFVNTHPIRKAE